MSGRGTRSPLWFLLCGLTAVAGSLWVNRPHPQRTKVIESLRFDVSASADANVNSSVKANFKANGESISVDVDEVASLNAQAEPIQPLVRPRASRAFTKVIVSETSQTSPLSANVDVQEQEHEQVQAQVQEYEHGYDQIGADVVPITLEVVDSKSTAKVQRSSAEKKSSSNSLRPLITPASRLTDTHVVAQLPKLEILSTMPEQNLTRLPDSESTATEEKLRALPLSSSVSPSVTMPLEVPAVSEVPEVTSSVPTEVPVAPVLVDARVASDPTASAPVAMEVAPIVPTSEPFKAWLWAGVGVNYQFYQQAVPEMGKAKFQNISGPTRSLRGGFQSRDIGLDLSYNETLGKMDSSDTVVVNDGEYVWKTLSTEVLYRNDEKSRWSFRFGFQHHVMPFMVRDPFDAIISVRSNSLTMLALGVDRVVPITERFRIESQLRYQHPLLSGTTDSSDFEVSPKLTFDGSIGGVTSLGARSRLGVFWYGQWHQYKFEYSGRTTFSGEQSLFYSNIELRYGLEF